MVGAKQLSLNALGTALILETEVSKLPDFEGLAIQRVSFLVRSRGLFQRRVPPQYVVTPAAIAGMVRSVLWMRTKL